MKVLKLFFVLLILVLQEAYGQNSIVQTAINQTRNAGFNTAQYEAWLYTRVVNSAIQRLPFRMLKPRNWDPLRVEKYPLIVMLHGRGEAGTENNFQLKHGGLIHQNAVNFQGVTFPGFVIFPQEPYGQWTNGPEFDANQVTTALYMVFDLLDSLKLKYNVDPNRIYIHGLSSGGSGTWAAIYNRPDLFAAALPMSAPGDTSQALKICSIPIWLSQGGVDTNPIPYISHLMMAALRKAGAVDTNLTRYIEYPGQGHGIWNNTYNNPDFFPYMLRQSKLNIMMLGSPSLCPGGKVDLSVTPSPVAAYSNDVYQYQWYFNGASIAGANTNRLYNVSIAGSYYVAFKRNALLPWTNTNAVNISTSAASTAPKITVNNSIVLPAPSGNSVTLSGPAGQKSYLWSNGATTQSINVNTSGQFSLQIVPQYGCASSFSNPITVRVGSNGANPPEAATGLAAYPTSTKSILVNWTDNANNETGYEVYRGIRKGGPYDFVTLLGANTNVAFDVNLQPLTTYYYKIRSVNADGGTMSLEEVRASTAKDFIVPTEPANFRFSAFNSNNIQFSWTASFDSAGISKYYVYNRDTLLGTSDTTFFNYPLSSLRKNAFFNFRVVAQDRGGNFSSPSNEIPFVNNGRGVFASYYEGTFNVLPNFSTLNPRATALVTNPYLNSSGVRLINTLTGAEVATSTTNIALNFEGFINIRSAGNYTFFTTSDDGSKLFINGIQVVNNDFNQGMTERSGTYNFPSVGWYPINVTYRQGAGGYGLQVRYQCAGCASVVGKNLIPTSVLSYFNTGTTSGILTSPTANVSLTGANFYPYNPSDKPRIRIQWNGLPTTFTGIVRGFEIYRTTTTGITSPTITSTAWRKIATVTTTTGIPNQYSFVDTTDSPGKFLVRNIRYWYALRAITSVGNSGYIGYRGTITATTFLGILVPNTLPGVPSAPTNLTATGLSNTIVNLAWNDNSNNESGFEIWRSYTRNGIYIRSNLVPRGYTSYNDSSCEANTKYVYKIRAYNASTTSAFSNIDSTYTLNMPTAPSGLKALSVGPNAVNLTWINNSDLSFGYSIYRSTNLKTGYTRLDSIANPTMTFYQDKSANANTEYYYKVRAYNNFNSAFSNIDSAFTLLAMAPETDWKLPVMSITSSFNTNYKNNLINRNKLYSTLLNREDFFNYISVQPSRTSSIMFKLPPLVSMPGGALFTFNLSKLDSLEDGQSLDNSKPNFTTINGGNFNYDLLRIPTDILFDISVSGSDLDTTSWNKINYTDLIYSNYLNKLEIPTSLAGRWLKIQLNNKLTQDVYASEMGLYKILPEGKRHNYFLLVGASIEQNSKALVGLRRFRQRLANAGYSNGSTALLFNVFSDVPPAAGPGKNSIQLANGIDVILDRHPQAEYVMVHQGGNNINNESNGMRPLTYDKILNKPEVSQYISSFENIYKSILSKGKIPLVSRMHFRDYGKYDNLLTVTSLAVHRGQKQEFGSLPYNLLLDSLCKVYAPFAYNEDERRSSFNYYAVNFSDQTIMGGDGIHPTTGSITVNKSVDYWVKYPMHLIYNGTQQTPILQTPGPINFCAVTTPEIQPNVCIQKYFNRSNYLCCGNVFPSDNYIGMVFSPNLSAPGNNTRAYFPSNKLGLLDSVKAAVSLAKRTALAKDIWNARILVEQVANTSVRIPYVMSLDSLRDFRSPLSPSGLSAFVVSSSSLSLSWFRNSLNNTGFEIWRSNTSTGTNFKKVGTITVAGTTNYLDTGLSGDTVYYYYVKAINSGYSSGWSNIVNARPSSTYYSKATGDVASTATWGVNFDGSGNSPLNFTGTGQTFILANRGESTTLINNWTVSGLYSKVIITNAQTLNTAANANLVGLVDLMANATLGIHGNANPTLGSIDTASVINFANSVTIPNKVYGHINFMGNGIRTLPTGTLNVYGNIGLSSGITLQGTNTVLNLNNSSITFETDNASLNNISINIAKGASSFDAKSGVLKLNNLTINGSSSLTLLNSSKLMIGANNGQKIEIQNGSYLDLKNGNLSITGNACLNCGVLAPGILKVNGGSLVFETSNSTQKVHNLLLDAENYEVNNFKVNLGTNTDTVQILSSLNLINTLKLERGVLKTNNYLTLISNLQNTARIAKVEPNARLAGEITAQRVVGPFKTQSAYMLGTPILNQPLSSWSNFIALKGLITTIDGVSTILGKTNSVFIWNETRNTWTAIANSATTLLPGTGYRITLRTQDLTNESNSGFYANTGVPVIGDASGDPSNLFTFSLKKSSVSGGWNVISNPYPSEIDWDTPNGWDKSNVENFYYVWDGVNKGYKVYVGATNTTTSAVSSIGMTSVINSGQGFLVLAKNIGNSTFTINENAKTELPALPVFYRKEVNENVLRLFVENPEGIQDEAIMRFEESATEEYDNQIDALKLEGLAVNISTITPSRKNLSVSSLPYKSSLVIPIYLKSDMLGGHKFSVQGLDYLEKGGELTLIDNYKKVKIDLNKNPNYNFEITNDSNSFGNNRLELHFSNNNFKTRESEVFYVAQNVPNPTSGVTQIKFYIPTADVALFELQNSIGQSIFKKTQFFEKGWNSLEIDLVTAINNTQLEGIYFYSITVNGQRITKKMIVSN